VVVEGGHVLHAGGKIVRQGKCPGRNVRIPSQKPRICVNLAVVLGWRWLGFMGADVCRSQPDHALTSLNNARESDV